jgi:diacylglycerol O-acyltransferase
MRPLPALGAYPLSELSNPVWVEDGDVDLDYHVRRVTLPHRYPASIPSHGMALNMTVQSYNGMLDFGLIACRRAVPDVEDIADYLLEEHRALLARIKAIEAAEATPHVAAATAANAAAKPRKKAVPAKAAARKRAATAAAATR